MQSQATGCQLVFLVRHGAREDKQGEGSTAAYASSCEANHAHDPPLSTLGVLQARITGRFIAKCLGVAALGKRIVVVSSPLRRCLQTADGIREGLFEDEDKASLRAQQQSSCRLEVSSGLYELFVENLFPVAPTYVVSPSMQDMLAASPSRRGAFASVHVDDTIKILSRYPESKRDSTARTLHAFDSAMAAACGRNNSAAPNSCDGACGADVVIVVAHQFNCHVIAAHLVEMMVRHDEQHQTTAATSGNNLSHARPSHVDWKKAARRMVTEFVQEEDSNEGGDSLFPGSCIPVQRDAAILNFDVCSVTLFEFQPSNYAPWTKEQALSARWRADASPPKAMRLISFKEHLVGTETTHLERSQVHHEE